MTGEALKLNPQSEAGEDVFVFGTDLGGRHESESARFAVALHQAEPGKGSGASGHAYAVPCRNTRGEMLGPEVIGNYLDSLFSHAAAHPGLRFRVARFGCEKDGHSDAVMARLFARAPENCVLPGLWQRLLHTDLPARLLVFDPGAHLRDAAWQERLQRYLSLNAPLWDAPSVELVSVGTARAIVANDVASRKLGLRHRVFGPNEAFYGRDAMLAAEAKAIWYATHMLTVFDFDQTAQPQQIRVMGAATRGGLAVDQVDCNADE